MAENKIRSFTDADIAALAEAVRKSRSQVQNTRLRHDAKPEDPFTPEVYVAYTPSGGIAAGSGTVPEGADCTIYRATTDDDTPVLEEADTYDRTVYNLGPSVPGSTFVLVVKDKWGTWWVVNGGDSSFLAVLTAVAYPDGTDGKREYSWWEVFPDTSNPGQYVLGTRNGCPGDNPAYCETLLYADLAVVEAGDSGTAGTGTGTGTAVDPTTGCTIPAYIHPLSVYRFRQVSVPTVGTGTANNNYCIFEGWPYIDLARDTGVEAGPGDGAYIWYRDQNDHVWKDGMYCILIPPE